jgi:hypothetical protein
VNEFDEIDLLIRSSILAADLCHDILHLACCRLLAGIAKYSSLTVGPWKTSEGAKEVWSSRQKKWQSVSIEKMHVLLESNFPNAWIIINAIPTLFAF